MLLAPMRRLGFVIILVLWFAPSAAQDLEWRTYGGDLASTRYSPADLITADNFNDLEVAWSLRTDNFGAEPEFNLQSTPLMVGGVLYSTVGSRRAVIAADAETGGRRNGGLQRTGHALISPDTYRAIWADAPGPRRKLFAAPPPTRL